MKQYNALSYRLKLISYLFYSVFFLIVIRFFFLQIFSWEKYRSLAEGNTRQKYLIIPPRGVIYDRNGKKMTINKNSYSLNIIVPFLPKDSKIKIQKLKQVSEYFRVNLNFLKQIAKKNSKNYRQIPIQEMLNEKELLFLSEHEDEFRFLNITEYSGRYYLLDSAAAHVLGYVGLINSREYKKLKSKGYPANTYIGKSGLERYYDSILRGKEGYIYRIVNALGEPIKNLKDEILRPIAGKNIILSLDSNLQEVVYEAMRNRQGSIIVSKADTGEILALVSGPSFNPNQFLNPEIRDLSFDKVVQDKRNPFLNRAIQGTYAPGSTFKPVVALAALEDNLVDPYKEEDTSKGYFQINRQIWRNSSKHASANMITALRDSNNVYFYQLGYRIGLSSIVARSKFLGIDQLSHIDLPSENQGIFPNMDWKEQQLKKPWVDGDTVNLAIGQGFLSFTPINLHRVYSFFASGRLVNPRIVWKVQNPYSKNIEKVFTPQFQSDYVANNENLKIIREGLKECVESGTARYHNAISPVPIAGKTGSAQRGGGLAHGWFASYGPLNKPLKSQYVITVLAESTDWGSRYALPVSSVLYNYLEGIFSKQQAINYFRSINHLPKNEEKDNQ